MTSSIYVTGTDTGVGKTVIAASLLAALNARGIAAIGMKPVASGCEQTHNGLRNADAQLLIAQSAIAADYALVNPYAFAEPIAPHLAAADGGVDIDAGRIVEAFGTLSLRAHFTLVEGVGGWMAPLGPRLMQCDIVKALRIPVLLVVGLRLGCLNHAMLSARAIRDDGCEMIGWIGNSIDPDMLRLQDNLAALRERLAAPCLGTIPFAAQPEPSALAPHLDLACSNLLA